MTNFTSIQDSGQLIPLQDNNTSTVFSYNGSPVSFQKGDSVMVNATEMAKPFGKRPVDWLQNQQTKEFLSELSKVRKSTSADLVKVTKGGNNQGTWLHEDVALEFARWLSPAFAIWCNDRIKELLTVGMTATQPTLEQMVSNPDLVISLATQLKKEREEKARLESEAEANAPKVLFAQAVETSKGSCLIAELAKILQQNGVSIGQNRLFAWLRDNGYLCSKGESRNQPTQRAMELGLFEIIKRTINNPNGSVLVTATTKVTGKGQVYFVNKFIGKAAV